MGSLRTWRGGGLPGVGATVEVLGFCLMWNLVGGWLLGWASVEGEHCGSVSWNSSYFQAGPTLISLPCHKGMRKGLHVNRQFIY